MGTDRISASEQYKQMFIDPDQKRFNERQTMLEKLKALDLFTSNAEWKSFLLKNAAEHNFGNILFKNTSFNNMITELMFQKNIAIARAKEDALKKGHTEAEAEQIAEKAGQEFDNKINQLNYSQYPQITKELEAAQTKKDNALKTFNDEHNKHFSASMNYQTSLFDQAMLASDISRNTQHYSFLKTAEEMNSSFRSTGGKFDQMT